MPRPVPGPHPADLPTVDLTRTLRTVLKRGALLAATNWQVTVIQFIGESTFKLLLAVPLVGGAVLVALVLGRDLADLLAGGVRDILTRVASGLLSAPIALAAFLVAFAIVLLGGSALTFLLKGGTVTVLVEADRRAGAIERPPLRFEHLRSASCFSIDRYTAGCRHLFRRYLRLGLLLMVVYGLSVGLYLAVIFGGYRLMLARPSLILGWTVIAGASSSVLVVWITIVNLLYLLVQIAVAVDDRSVRASARQVARFLRAELREVLGVFGVVLVLVLLATVLSILATAGLSLIAFVPLFGLVVLPLQLAAWMFRSLVFQYLGITALAAYLRLYRGFSRSDVSPMSQTA